MLRWIFLFSVFLFFYQQVNAQQVQGIVVDMATQLRLGQVEVFNRQTKEKTLTSDKGEFTIRAYVNQSLIFYQPGYLPDTLFLIDTKFLKRALILNNRLLKTVVVKGGAFNPREEYADTYRKAQYMKLAQNKPFIFSPSRYFGKEGRDARRFKRKLEREIEERKIDSRFNETAVRALTPLNGAELDYFMVLYRPALKKLDKMDEEDFRFYIMNSYKAFKALPAEQRVSPSMSEN